MNNNDTDQRELEHFFRKKLATHTEPADGDALWEQIAQQQQPLNAKLRMRYYALKTLWLLLVATLVTLVWWATSRQPASPPPSVLPQPDSTAVALESNPQNAEQPLSALPLGTSTAVTIRKSGSKSSGLPAWVPDNAVPLERLRFFAEEGLRYQSAISGNEVFIPANSLVDATGAPVEGEAELYFREYRTFSDFLAADIPMHYADKRGQYVFNSGGMFDVRVGQGTSELFMAPGKEYTVRFTPTDRLKDANLYYFNDESEKWDFVPSNAFGGRMIADNGEKLPVATTMQQAIQDNTDGSQQVAACMAQPVSLNAKENIAEWMRDAVQGGKKLSVSTQKAPKWLAKYAYTNPPTTALFDLPADIEIVFQKDLKTYFFPQDNRGVQTELLAFKDYFFVRTGDSLIRDEQEDGTVKTYNVEVILRQKNHWNNIEIRNIEGDKCEVLLLDDAGKSIQIHAKLNQSREVANKETFNPTAIYTEYKQLRQKRLTELALRIRQMARFIRLAPLFQTEAEWCMEAKDWIIYFDQNRLKMQARYDSLLRIGMADNEDLAKKTFEQWNKAAIMKAAKAASVRLKNADKRQSIMTTLQLAGFGMYNCDQIYRLDQQPILYVQASYQTPNGEPITPTELRVVDWENRIFLPMATPKTMVNFPGRRVDMVLTDTGGQHYYLSGRQYSVLDLENKSNYTFTMEKISEKVSTPEDWANLLQM